MDEREDAQLYMGNNKNIDQSVCFYVDDSISASISKCFSET